MRTLITSLLAATLAGVVAGCAAPGGAAGRVVGGGIPAFAPDMGFQVQAPEAHDHRGLPKYELQASSTAQPWGIQIRQGKAQYSLEYSMMPGYRFRFVYGHFPNPVDVLAQPPVYDAVVTDRNTDVGGYTGRGSFYWISAWRDTISELGNVWWQPQSHPTAKIQQMQATENNRNVYSVAMTGYVYLPRRANYKFRLSQSSAPWYGYNVNAYLKVGFNEWYASNGRTGRDTNAEWVTNTSATYNAGPVAFTYITPSCHTSCGGYYMNYSTDNGATWERFPDNAFQIRTDLGNQQPVLTGGTTTFQYADTPAQFFTRGAAVLTGQPSTSATDAYDASFDPAWKGKITKVNYAVPNDKYLVLNAVYAYDFINSTSRSRYPTFVTLDNLVVDAPVASNGLKGSMIYGPGEVVSLGVPILTSIGGAYRPEIIVSGNLIDKQLFESGGAGAFTVAPK